MMNKVTVYLPAFRPESLTRLIHSLGTPPELDAIVVGVSSHFQAECLYEPYVKFYQYDFTGHFNFVKVCNWLPTKHQPASHYWVLNDDAYVVGEWACQAVNVPQGNIGKTNCPQFPVMTSWHLDKFGWLFPPQFSNYGCDVWINKTYKQRMTQTSIRLVHEQTEKGCAHMARLSGPYHQYLMSVDELEVRQP